VDQQDASRKREVMCDEVLAMHSDYLDGLLAAHEAARVQWHLSSCSSCARYDRVVRRGGELLRELPKVMPSDDFAERLQHRIFHLQDGEKLGAQRAGAAATFAVASVIALLAWSPLFFAGEDSIGVASVTEEQHNAPFLPAPALLGGVGDVWLPAPLTGPLGNTDPLRVLASFPGPHSRLVVNPPLHGTVRTVSSEYTSYD
jgi:hypothetical protein